MKKSIVVKVLLDQEYVKIWTELAGGRNHRSAYLSNLLKAAAELPALQHKKLEPIKSNTRKKKGVN